MSYEKNNEKNEHIISIISRNNIRVTAVKKTVSFDEYSVILSTACGEVEIYGENLHVESLDPECGTAIISGTFNGLNYICEKRKRRALFRVDE